MSESHNHAINRHHGNSGRKESEFGETRQMTGKYRFAISSCLVAALVWGLCAFFWTSESQLEPGGDAAYFTSMSYAFLGANRGRIDISAMHSRRVLGPFLVGGMLRAQGVDIQEPIQWSYRLSATSRAQWSPHQVEVYPTIHRDWQILNLFSFVLLIFSLALLIPQHYPWGVRGLISLNFILTPCLGLLMVYWPQMNDTLCLALFALGLVLLNEDREVGGLMVLGLASIAREQVLLLLPFVYLFKRFSLANAFVFAVLPYISLCIVPLFPKVIPWTDATAGAKEGTLSLLGSYKIIFLYNWKFFWAKRGLVLPISLLLNFGTCLIPIVAFCLYRDFRFKLLIFLAFFFLADRHMAPLNLLTVFALAQMDPQTALRPQILFWSLLGLAFAKVLLLVSSQSALWLQAEHWFRIIPPKMYVSLFVAPWLIGVYIFTRNLKIIKSLAVRQIP